MPPLLSISDVSQSYGSRPLFKEVSFAIEPKERVGLIGPNGAGKSTLLQIITGKMSPDTGTVVRQRGLRMGFLEQVPLFSPGATVFETLLEGSHHKNHHDDESLARAYELMSKLNLDEVSVGADKKVHELSGGWKKRVALARELMCDPDLLILDEPTNHLDVESILWLEEFLGRADFATLTVTHDRFFLQNVTNRIIELDKKNPGGLLSVRGSYEDYLIIKQDLISGQERREDVLKNTLKREVEWLRRGAKARSTKQQARIQRAGELATEVGELEYRNQSRTVSINFGGTGHHPKKLLEAIDISKSINGHFLFKKLSLQLTPRSRLGLLGANGCGKSTLIRVLLGQEKADEGQVNRSDKLKVAYFEQNRESLNPQDTIMDAVSPNSDQVVYRGSPVHIKGYLDRFLFTPLQMTMKVGQLSGGEQSRLLIARLMLQEANLLVLDEPTNDLDLATLGVLEDCLTEFEGSVLLVTHDRFFLDRVATKILAFSPVQEGKTEFFSDLSQWENWRKDQEKVVERKNVVVTPPVKAKKSKLSYKDQLELDGMESAIQKVEAELASLNEEIALPENVSHAAKLMELNQSIEKKHKEIESLYMRWSELEAKSG